MNSLWEDAAIAVLIAVALLAIRRSLIRYALGCAGLALMIALPVLTPLPIRSEPISVHSSLNFIPPMAVHQTAIHEAPIAATIPAAPSPWTTWVVAAWLTGILGLSLRHIFGWLQVRRLALRTEDPAPQWRTMLKALAVRLRVSPRVRLRISRRLQVPAVIDWLRPIILVPASALSGLAVAEVEALLLHELAHVRRHDYLVNLIQIGVEALLFYHPAVWWVSATVRQERENCCDDLAADRCESRILYARALTTMEELRGMPGRLALGAKGGRLLARVRRIVGLPAARQDRKAPALAALMALATCLTLFGIAPRLVAQQVPATRPDAPIADTDTGVKPEDLRQDKSDYQLCAGDLVSVSIMDLMGEGTGEKITQMRVSDGGSIDLPFVRPTKAEGLTEAELEQSIRDTYANAGQIRNARVTVTVVEARGRRINILGDVRNAGQYDIPSGDMRLLDALAAAGGNIGKVQSVLIVRDPSRRIEISGPRLMAGDADVNVFIRPHDSIIVTQVPGSGPVAIAPGRIDARDYQVAELAHLKVANDMALAQAQNRLDTLTAEIKAGNDPPEFTDSLNADPFGQGLRNRLTAAADAVTQEEQTYGPSSEAVAQARKERDIISAQLKFYSNEFQARMLEEAKQNVKAAQVADDEVTAELTVLSHDGGSPATPQP